MSNRHQSIIGAEIEQIELVDTHEHLVSLPEPVMSLDDISAAREPLPAEYGWVRYESDVLQDLFNNYVKDDLVVAGATEDAVQRALDPSAGEIEERFDGIEAAWQATRLTGYGEAVQFLASEIYGLEELTAAGLRQAQARLQELQAPGEMLRLLTETAHLDHVQIDDVCWSCRPDETGPDRFLYDISWWGLCKGEIAADQILDATGIEVRTLDDLRDAMAAIVARNAACAIAIKAQHAYNRTLRWEERSDDEAARALAATLAGRELGEAARLALGDWCWARGVELAIEHDLPFKLHTGYYSGHGWMPVDRIKPGHLCSLLARYPQARFVLMHIAYPYNNELLALAKHYPNVWVDLCWAWSIDPHSASDFVRRLLHTVPINKLFAFGGDTRSPTQIVAYSIQARRWLTRALEAEVAAGDLSERQAIGIARRVRRENQYACFDIEGTRAAIRNALAPGVS